jgi:hypothetical protein
MWFGNRSGRAEAETWMAEQDETRRLGQRAGGVEIRVRTGCLLVTREGDPEDHVLGAGDRLLVTGPGLAVAWALEPSQVTLFRPPIPAAAEPPRRAA